MFKCFGLLDVLITKPRSGVLVDSSFPHGTHLFCNITQTKVEVGPHAQWLRGRASDYRLREP